MTERTMNDVQRATKEDRVSEGVVLILLDDCEFVSLIWLQLKEVFGAGTA